MKLIPESLAFDAINTALNFDTVDGYVTGRLESYSCKMVAQDKALYKKKFTSSEDAGIHELLALSPPRCADLCDSRIQQTLYRSQSVPSSSLIPPPPANGDSALLSSSNTDANVGSFEDAAQHEDKILRKTLFYLVSTLNAAFSRDYDFSNSTSMEFSKEHSLQHVMRCVERQLEVVSRSQLQHITERLWPAIDEAINLADCQIYTYNPDETSDPYSDDGCLWSFNYFFYNHRLKRIVFFTCRLVRALGLDMPLAGRDDYYMDSDVDFDD